MVGDHVIKAAGNTIRGTVPVRQTECHKSVSVLNNQIIGKDTLIRGICSNVRNDNRIVCFIKYCSGGSLSTHFRGNIGVSFAVQCSYFFSCGKTEPIGIVCIKYIGKRSGAVTGRQRIHVADSQSEAPDRVLDAVLLFYQTYVGRAAAFFNVQRSDFIINIGKDYGVFTVNCGNGGSCTAYCFRRADLVLCRAGILAKQGLFGIVYRFGHVILVNGKIADNLRSRSISHLIERERLSDSIILTVCYCKDNRFFLIIRQFGKIQTGKILCDLERGNLDVVVVERDRRGVTKRDSGRSHHSVRRITVVDFYGRGANVTRFRIYLTDNVITGHDLHGVNTVGEQAVADRLLGADHFVLIVDLIILKLQRIFLSVGDRGTGEGLAQFQRADLPEGVRNYRINGFSVCNADILIVIASNGDTVIGFQHISDSLDHLIISGVETYEGICSIFKVRIGDWGSDLCTAFVELERHRSFLVIGKRRRNFSLKVLYNRQVSFFMGIFVCEIDRSRSADRNNVFTVFGYRSPLRDRNGPCHSVVFCVPGCLYYSVFADGNIFIDLFTVIFIITQINIVECELILKAHRTFHGEYDVLSAGFGEIRLVNRYKITGNRFRDF